MKYLTKHFVNTKKFSEQDNFNNFETRRAAIGNYAFTTSRKVIIIKL